MPEDGARTHQKRPQTTWNEHPIVQLIKTKTMSLSE